MTAPIPDPQVGERLVRIETKLDQALATHADHEARIRRLERVVWGAASAAATGGAGIAAFLTKIFGG